MQASWTVSIEPSRLLLRMAITGFFTVDDVHGFAADITRNIARLRPFLHGVQHISICDTRGVEIQSQDAVAAFAEMLENPVARSRRLAYIADAALARIQIRRLTARDNAAFFATMAEAEAWVFSP
ncbi:hypothetical protein [Sphingomonas panni]|uniref:hypothetical protein n=1 Tax=Sphingomonas panni TaxID=237612 RepID=UPI001F5B605F|nr:hypothetical protein [Sphingomonas panni]